MNNGYTVIIWNHIIVHVGEIIVLDIPLYYRYTYRVVVQHIDIYPIVIVVNISNNQYDNKAYL